MFQMKDPYRAHSILCVSRKGKGKEDLRAPLNIHHSTRLDLA